MERKKTGKSGAGLKLVGIFVALLIVVALAGVSYFASAENRKVVTVMRFKSDVEANQLITADMLEPYDMYYKEFADYGTIDLGGKTYQAVVTEANAASIEGRLYSSYHQRGGTLLFWDSLTTEQVKKNSYLYSMSAELLNIHLTPTSEFGTMVVPGDRLNIRVTYTKTDYSLPTVEEFKLALKAGDTSLVTSVTSKTVTEELFPEVTVLDMLNSSGNSIFDIYSSYITKSVAEQEALLANADFVASVQPASILLEATSEEVEHYMEVSAAGGSFMMTLLPRTGSNSIIDSLSAIQEAVGSGQ